MGVVVAFLLVLAVLVQPASAQSARVSLVPPDPPRWDVSGAVGSRSENNAELATDWNRWATAASFTGSLGYYWTTHLKTEVDITAATESNQQIQGRLDIGGPAVYRFGEQQLQTTAASVGVLYQFAENSWVHPFVGGGIETVRERSRLALQLQPTCSFGTPCAPSALPVERTTEFETRPFVSGGFKFYVTERAFIRTDIRAMLSTQRAEAVLWRFGVGTDF
jgi:hypothetical protein